MKTKIKWDKIISNVFSNKILIFDFENFIKILKFYPLKHSHLKQSCSLFSTRLNVNWQWNEHAYMWAHMVSLTMSTEDVCSIFHRLSLTLGEQRMKKNFSSTTKNSHSKRGFLCEFSNFPSNIKSVNAKQNSFSPSVSLQSEANVQLINSSAWIIKSLLELLDYHQYQLILGF